MKPIPVYRYLRLFLICYLLSFGGFYLFIGGYVLAGSLGKSDLLDLSNKPAGSDFVVYWTASKVARTQSPDAVFSRETMAAAEREVIAADIPPRIWNYPPTFLLMVLPLSLLPYFASLLAWLGSTFCGFIYVIRRLLPHRGAWLFLFFPGAVSNFLYGQNGFLSTIFLGGGLLLMDRHPFLGGSLLGLMSYKPQLALLIPLALAAGRCWQALAGAICAAAGLALASLFRLGWDPWISFFKNLSLAAGLLERPHLWGKMPTIFAALAQAGVSPGTALGLQLAGTVGVGCLVARVWFRGAPLPRRGSVLALGSILATPYAFAYDLAIIALPVAWLGWEAYRNGWIADEVLLLLAWALMAWASLGIPGPLSWAAKFPLSQAALAALLILALYRVHRPAQLRPSS
jgi:hypothetical protein